MRKDSIFLKIFSNFSWTLGGEVAGRVFGFLAVIVLARRLGKSSYGMWAFAMALLSYGMLLTDFGLNTYATLEVSKNRDRLKDLLGNILAIRTLIAIFSIVMITFFSFIIPKFKPLSDILFLTFLNLIPFALMVDWAFKGLEDMKYNAIWSFIFYSLFFVLILLLVHTQEDLLKVPASRFIAISLATLLSLFFLYTKYRELFAFNIDLKSWLPILKVSGVLAASFVMIKIYYNIDVVMLGFFRSMKEVGVYSAIYNFVLALSVVRFSLLYAVQPTLARYETTPWEKFSKFVRNFEFISISVGIILYIFVLLAAGPIIKIFYGAKYWSPETVKLLRILVNANLIMFVNLVFPTLLIVARRETLYFWVTTAGAVSNFLLNLIFVPKFGYFGAAYTTVLSELIVFVVSFSLYYRLIKL